MNYLIHLLFNKMSSYSLSLIVATTFLSTPFAFLCLLLLSTKNKYMFGLNPTNSSITTLLVSTVFFPITTLLQS